jgi:hypothetical protein
MLDEQPTYKVLDVP